MKIVFFLILLANLVFFLWHYQAGDFQQAINKEAELSVTNPKQIWLLSELEKKPPAKMPKPHDTVARPAETQPLLVSSIDPVTQMTRVILAPPATVSLNAPAIPVVAAAPATPVTPATPATPVTPAIPKTPTPPAASVKVFYCYQVGSFSSKAAASHWMYKQPGSFKRIREKPAEIADYLVYYSGTKSDKNSQFLKTHGIKEFFIVPSGEFKGAISLGIFKNEVYAVKTQQTWIKKGIPAKIGKRYKTQAAVFVKIKTEKSKRQLAVSLAKYAGSPGVELLSQCD